MCRSTARLFAPFVIIEYPYIVALMGNVPATG